MPKKIEDKIKNFFKNFFTRKKLSVFSLFFMFSTTFLLFAADFEIPYFFKAGDMISSSQVNANFEALRDEINDLKDQLGAVENLPELQQTVADLEAQLGPLNGLGTLITQVDDIEAMLPEVPAGTIVAYGGPNVPSGWLLCDGSPKDRLDARYTALFDAIGTRWGGDGAPNFNLPDLRGIFLRGARTSAVLKKAKNNPGDPDVFFSGILGEYKEDMFQSHYHDVREGVYDEGNSTLQNQNTICRTKISGANVVPLNDGPRAKGPVKGTRGEIRTGWETNPANASVNYIIKY